MRIWWVQRSHQPNQTATGKGDGHPGTDYGQRQGFRYRVIKLAVQGHRHGDPGFRHYFVVEDGSVVTEIGDDQWQRDIGPETAALFEETLVRLPAAQG